MDITQLLNGVIENLVAGFPELVLVITTVTYSLKSIKTKTAMFPEMLNATKAELKSGYDKTKDNMVNLLHQNLTQIEGQIKQELISMAGNLKNYEQELVRQQQQSNLLVQQNKLFMDIITDFVKASPELVQSGVAQALSTKVNLTKEELEQYPQLLVNDLELLTKSLADAAVVIGQQKFDELIGKFGYERKEV